MIKDKIIKYRNSLIQHGKLSDRVYLMKLGSQQVRKVIEYVETLAEKNGYGKIFAKIPDWSWKYFKKKNYVIEAEIPRFYDCKVTALFLAKYFDDSRRTPDNHETILEVIEAANAQYNNRKRFAQSLDSYDIFEANEFYAEQIADVYKQVFKSYPFPIFDPEYIKKTMQEDTHYFCAQEKESGTVIAASSAETDPVCSNAEMTDFAVIPDHRGKDLAVKMLNMMEIKMNQKSIQKFYTIARAASFGMNITFARNGYQFGGTLINNTNIAGQIESMNVWYK